MRKIFVLALAGLMSFATPVFVAQTASAQQAPDQQCPPGQSGFPGCIPYGFWLGALGLGLLAALIIIESNQNHHYQHQQVSP
jgi:hypothetical protein